MRKVEPKRYIADTLSAANLACGVLSMVFAAQGRFDISLFLLILGAGFDGFDGAAARRWGGTRWGVYSDDVADGVNYGLAPGVALYFALGGAVGLAIGIAYAVFTIGRLVFFTLDKDNSDPAQFAGVPSTFGGLIVLSAILLFPNEESLIGAMVGVACTLMVSFSTHYEHLGRQLGAALRERKRVLLGVPLTLAAMLSAALLWGIQVPVAALLVASVAYGFGPTAAAFVDALRRRRANAPAAVS